MHKRQRRSGFLFGATVLLLASLSVHARAVSGALRFNSGEGCIISATGVRLWPSEGDEHRWLYLEAEDAEFLAFADGGGVIEDAACSGGAFLTKVARAEFSFSLEESAEYQLWARAYLPQPGNWNHTESMDGGAEVRVSDSAAGVFGRWYWTALGRYRLDAGAHRFVLHSWLGGARLDALVVARAGGLDPTGSGSFPAEEAAGLGWVTSAPLVPAPLSMLESLEVNAELHGGSLAAELSCDGGLTWHPVPADGDLRDIPVIGDGRDVLQVRFTLGPSAAGRSPQLQSAVLHLDVSEGAESTLENAHYRLVFSSRTGTLVGIDHRAARTQAMVPGFQERLLGLAVREHPGGPITELAAEQIDLLDAVADERQAVFTYGVWQGAVRLTLRVTRDESPLSVWELEIDNQSEREIVRVDFPRLGRLAIGSPADDECVMPHTGGRRVGNPAGDRRWVSTYLGGGSMAWLDLCDNSGGVYLSVQDPALTTTDMICEPSLHGDGTDLQFRAHTLVAPGQQRTRRAVVGIHAGDWHWAADQYRAWARTWLKAPENPDWVRWSDGWAGAMAVPFEQMERMLQQAQQEGLDYLQCWGQMADGIDQCCGNFYWPAPELGGDEGFREAVAGVHAAGGRVTAYMNCQTWTRDSAINDSLRRTPKTALPGEALELIHPLEWFERWRLYPADGAPVGYYAGTHGWYIMCPASQGFRDHLRFWIVDMYAGRYGVDGIYLDQAGATRAKPCYRLDHGHDDIGAWGWGNVALLEACVREARRVNPDFIMAIEGAGDALGQFASLHLISGLCTAPEVYHYTFPEHILISGRSNNSPLSSAQRISRAFLNGDRFDARLGDRNLISALQLRQRIKWWLYPGRFMDTVGLSLSDPRVLGRWNLCQGETGEAVVLVFDNESRVEGAHCELRLPDDLAAAGSLFLFEREGTVTVAPAPIEEGTLRFEIPGSSLSAALLLQETAPEYAVDVWARDSGDVQRRGAIALNVLNLGTERQTGKVEVTAAAPLVVPAAERLFSLRGGSVGLLTVPITGFDRLSQPAGVTVRLVWPSGERRVRIPFRPLLLNPGLAVDEDRNGDPDHWSAGGSTPRFERGVEQGAAWIQGRESSYLYLMQHVPLRPLTRYRFACRIRRSEATAGISAAVVEFLEGRGLRVHRIGDDPEAAANDWQAYETEFTTGEQFRDSAIYLYNTNTTARAWYDEVELLELGDGAP